MWRYFWSYETDLPPGTNVPEFSKDHLAWVFISLMIIIAVAIIYRKQTVASRRRIEIVLGVLLAASYILRWIWAAMIGHFYMVEMLPLHLCALTAIVEVIAVFSRRPLLKEFGYACGIPGAIVVFLMPGIGPYPIFHFYYLLFIMDHTILLLLPLIWVWGEGFRPNINRLWRCFLILLVMAGIAVYVNMKIGSNFMFLNGVAAGIPLKPAADFFGDPGYQFVMAAILLVVWVFLYAPWMIVKKSKTHI